MNSETLSTADLGIKIFKLQVGHSLIVNTDKERREALAAARTLGKSIATRKTKAGKFTITALPGDL